MATTVTEIRLQFRAPPRLLFAVEGDRPEANVLQFRMKPDDSIIMHLQSKRPGDELATCPVDLRVSSSEVLGDAPEAYEQLLDDAMDGDQRRFGRQDSVEEQWRIVEPALDTSQPYIYRRGSWGPRVDRSVQWHDEEPT